ncbi:MAG: hypothetical protein OXH24_07770 [Cyanobacteria bacterium MAG IRC3_bin_20]|nr:hypothetical protein [Cyanobacteria bacterium MAG IRC3_bin_20]
MVIVFGEDKIGGAFGLILVNPIAAKIGINQARNHARLVLETGD